MSLAEIARGRVVVLGIGNIYKSDDGAGSLVAQALRKRFSGVVFDAEAAPENFVGPVRRAEPDTVIIVDAGDFEGDPGEIRIIAPEELQGLMTGTHATPLGTFMTFIAEETAATTHLVAVQAKSTELGGPVSEEVAAAVDRLVSELTEILERRTDR